MAARSRNNALKAFYSRGKTIIGAAKAVIALARKIVVIIWHLLINDELYEDGPYTMKNSPKHVRLRSDCHFRRRDNFNR